MTFQVVTRWGDDLLDVLYLDDDEQCRIGEVDIALVDGARERVGLVDVFVSKVTLPPRELRYARGDDWRVAPYLGLALAVHLAVWGIAMTAPPPPETCATQQPEPRPVKLHSFADAVVEMPKAVTFEKPFDTKEPGSGTPMAREPGAAGALQHERDEGHIAVENKQQKPQLSKSEAVQHAREAEMLGVNAITQEQLRMLTGSMDLTSGFDGASVNGALVGGEGASEGAWGTSYSGDMHGGGGADGNTTIGISDHGAFSNGVSDGEGWGAERGPCLPGLWVELEICETPYTDSCLHFGDVSERAIRRAVERHTNKIARCWGLAYVANHAVSGGPLTVDFAIARNGRVRRASASGITDNVARCVAGVYKKIKFPRMRDIGMQIRHVLVFRRSTRQ